MTTLNFSCLDDYDPESLPVDRARAILLDMLPAVTGHERVFIRQALGRVLADDVISPVDVPAHDNSAMDGWAVRSADLAASGETRLKNAGTAFAGRAFEGTVSRGEAVRIMTGAVLPAGADCVVMQEVARAEGEAVIVPPGQRAEQHIRARRRPAPTPSSPAAASRSAKPTSPSRSWRSWARWRSGRSP